MTAAATILEHTHIRHAIMTAPRIDTPYRHWLPRDILPGDVCDAVRALPFDPPEIADTLGKRDTNNTRRIFISEANRTAHPVFAALAGAFQDEATVALFEDICGIELTGALTRIEYCLDTGGFWLEPHTDIGAKLLTFLIYLSDHPDAEHWGTDIMNAQGAVLGRAEGVANCGLMFVPAADTWHGFVKRSISGVRRTLIVNYVKPEWRSLHELAFPGQPVISA